jgi:hypothetical protein
MLGVVEQLLQALVEADPDRCELTGLPPRHDPPPPFAELEREIASAFPALAHVGYPAVLQALYAHVPPVLACELVQFVASDQEAPLDGLRELVFRYNPELIAGQGLLAIADEGHAQGPLCLDTRVGGPPEAWPVVLWRHGWEDVTATLDSSAERMLACVTHRLRGGRIAELAAIDPQGSVASYYGYLDRPATRAPALDHGVLPAGAAPGAGGPTQVVDQLLRVLVADGSYGLTWPPPRHDPRRRLPNWSRRSPTPSQPWPRSATQRRCKPSMPTHCRSWTAARSHGLSPPLPARRCGSCGHWYLTAGSPN